MHLLYTGYTRQRCSGKLRRHPRLEFLCDIGRVDKGPCRRSEEPFPRSSVWRTSCLSMMSVKNVFSKRPLRYFPLPWPLGTFSTNGMPPWNRYSWNARRRPSCHALANQEDTHGLRRHVPGSSSCYPSSAYGSCCPRYTSRIFPSGQGPYHKRQARFPGI